MTAPSIAYAAPERLAGRTRVATQGVDLRSYEEYVQRLRTTAWIPFYGPARVAGTVKVISTAAPNRTVRLYDRVSGLLAFETVSEIDGTYSFPTVFAGRQYYAIALDTQPGGYNATIEDLVTPT